MNKTFLIGGTIIDDESQAWALEDVTPSQVRAFLAKLEPAEGVEFQISSPGGSVTAGLAIANLIREARKQGHEITAHVIGIAASMASVIACAADKIVMDASAFFMIHNPWTATSGDADDLRKSADVLDQMKMAIMGFYRTKFDKTADELAALMNDETWFTGSQAADFAFDCEVLDTDEPLRAAACAKTLPNFVRCPAAAEHLFVVCDHQQNTVEVTVAPKADNAETVAPTAAEPTAPDGSEPADATQPTPPTKPAPSCCRTLVVPTSSNSSPTPPAPPAEPPAAPKSSATTSQEPTFEQRLAAAMRSRDTQINDLKSQLAKRDEELAKANANATHLQELFDKADSELKATSSALETAKQALATLNANVNTPHETVLPTLAEGLAKCATPAERSAFIASGNYRH